jgi:LCP family protein required for cell wall assembly
MTKAKKTPFWVRMIGGIFYLLVCMVGVAAGTALGWIGRSEVVSAVSRQLLAQTKPESVFGGREAIHVLVLGCDEDRMHGGKTILKHNARSDMMLVARLDFAHDRISGISIPRDLEVALPGFRRMKINSYYAYGAYRGGDERAKELAQRAAEHVLGVEIDRTLVLNYEEFQKMVDLVGGVDVFVPKRLKYTDRRGDLYIDLKPGLQRLGGYDAMCFVRYRHGDSDFERQKRQKDFLFAFKDRVLSNPGLIGAVADKAKSVMGGAMTPDEVAALALFARRVPSDSIKIGQVPVLETRGTSSLRLDDRKLDDVLRQFHFLDRGRVTLNSAR